MSLSKKAQGKQPEKPAEEAPAIPEPDPSSLDEEELGPYRASEGYNCLMM